MMKKIAIIVVTFELVFLFLVYVKGGEEETGFYTTEEILHMIFHINAPTSFFLLMNTSGAQTPYE